MKVLLLTTVLFLANCQSLFEKPTPPAKIQKSAYDFSEPLDSLKTVIENYSSDNFGFSDGRNKFEYTHEWKGKARLKIKLKVFYLKDKDKDRIIRYKVEMNVRYPNSKNIMESKTFILTTSNKEELINQVNGILGSL